MNALHEILHAVQDAVEGLGEEVPLIAVLPNDLDMGEQTYWTEDEIPYVVNALAGVLGMSTAEIKELEPSGISSSRRTLRSISRSSSAPSSVQRSWKAR